MVKLVTISGKDFCKILVKLGFEKIYGKGSHVRFKHPDGRRTVLPIHNRPVRTGTLRAILKQVDISLEEFLDML